MRKGTTATDKSRIKIYHTLNHSGMKREVQSIATCGKYGIVGVQAVARF